MQTNPTPFIFQHRTREGAIQFIIEVLRAGVQVTIHPSGAMAFAPFDPGENHPLSPDEQLAKDRQRAYSAKRKALMCSSREWLQLRLAVIKRDGGRCVYCGGSGGTFSLECDHVTPVSKGGACEMQNLVTACKSCNASKRAEDAQIWRAKRGL